LSTTLDQYLEYIFSSQENFEKAIFEVQSDAERIEILEIIAKQIVHEEEIKSKINFTHVKSLNNLNLSDLAFNIVRLLLNEAVEWLAQYFSDEAALRSRISQDKMKVYMIHEMAMSYYFDHQEIFLSEIAESYFELLQEAEGFRYIAKIGHEAISGTSKVRSLFLLDDGAQIVRRADQVWMRVDQASKAKKRKIFALTGDLQKNKEAVEDLQIRIASIDMAAKMSAASLRRFTPEKVRNIFTEDDPKYLADRRLLASLPAGEMCYIMETMCEKAAIASRTSMGKDDFKKIQAFFAKAKINNTPNELKMKRMEYEHKLPFKVEKYKEIAERYQNIQDEPLENFDEQLLKIKNVLVANLKKFNVNR
jgi:hypothetical protein